MTHESFEEGTCSRHGSLTTQEAASGGPGYDFSCTHSHKLFHTHGSHLFTLRSPLKSFHGRTVTSAATVASATGAVSAIASSTRPHRARLAALRRTSVRPGRSGGPPRHHKRARCTIALDRVHDECGRIAGACMLIARASTAATACARSQRVSSDARLRYGADK